MGAGQGEGGLTPRLFLVAPEAAPAARLIACLEAAAAAGDVASLLVQPSAARAMVAVAQPRGIAVLVAGDHREALRCGADGIQVEAGAEAVADARQSLGRDRIVGAHAGNSRHLAMDAADAGADYIAFAQSGPTVGGEPILRWWADLTEIPGVAFEPADAAALDALLPQKPDFIRPSDAMWEDADSARRVVAEIAARLGLP